MPDSTEQVFLASACSMGQIGANGTGDTYSDEVHLAGPPVPVVRGGRFSVQIVFG